MQGFFEFPCGAFAGQGFILPGSRRIRYQVEGVLGIPFLNLAPKPLSPAISHHGASVPIPDSILQNSMEQRAPFRLTPCRVPLDECQHGILNEIKCLVWILRGNVGETKGAPFDRGQETVQ